MNTFVVSNIQSSIEIMDEFVDNNYDYLELKDWYGVSDCRNRTFNPKDNSGHLRVSLIISKERTANKPLCEHSPTMSELRQQKHHHFYLDSSYPEGSISKLICDACRTWIKDVFIPLPTEILLRAQTSYNRMDYGCEWLGGGDWEEKTLYGETTDFFIIGIILHDAFKFTEQIACELLNEWRTQEINIQKRIFDSLETLSTSGTLVYQKVLSHPLKEGRICKKTENIITIDFAGKLVDFLYPNCFLDGFIVNPMYEDNIKLAKDLSIALRALNLKIKKLENAIDLDDFNTMYNITHGFEANNN